MCPLKPQFMGTAEPCAIRRRFGKQDVQFRRRIRQDGRAPVADPHHQRGLTVMHRHHRMEREDQPGPGPREAHEGQAGQDGGEREPTYNLAGRNNTAIGGRRIHIAIADCRERLDAKKERVREVMLARICYGTRVHPKQRGEDEVRK